MYMVCLYYYVISFICTLAMLCVHICLHFKTILTNVMQHEDAVLHVVHYVLLLHICIVVHFLIHKKYSWAATHPFMGDIKPTQSVNFTAFYH